MILIKFNQYDGQFIETTGYRNILIELNQYALIFYEYTEYSEYEFYEYAEY